MPDGDRCDAARDEFVVRYVTDKDHGRLKSEAEYLRLYPGCEDAIAREWRRLRDLPVWEAAPQAPPATASSQFRGGSLGRYRIERELGRGAQGTVFEAFDTILGRRVALKVLKTSWSASATMVKRFELEAQALARLDHPGIVAVHDVGSTHGLEYFAMRFVEGRTLAQEASDRPATAAADGAAMRYVRIVEQCARALHVAHEAGLVHRDVKPSNIMITTGDQPVVLDFGLARLRDADAVGGLTATRDLLGTPAFMAPEQLSGDRNRIDRRTDVYALAKTLRALLAAGAHSPRRRDLEAVLDTAADPAPDHRYATAAAFADDLARVRKGAPVAVRPIGPLRRFTSWVRTAPAAAALVLLPPAALLAGLVALSFKNAEIRAAATELATREAEADAAARRATERFAAFRRLEDLRLARQLEARERELWPLEPASVPGLERWLDDAAELSTRLPGHRAALDSLRARGAATVVREPGASPLVDRLLHAERVFHAAAAELASPTTPDEIRAVLGRHAQKAAERVWKLDKEVRSHPTWSFEATSDQWLHDNLAELVSRLEALDGSARYGCTRASVLSRLETAGLLAERTLVAPADAWREAVAAIANPATDPAYGGLRIQPIVGLVPLGRDPRSHLWEFAHVLSGAPPARDAAGTLLIGADSAIVLVLVPGGTTVMGARRPMDDERPNRDHLDPMAQEKESPPHEVTLDPYFLSKYEMTQGQWLRMAGSNPSFARSDRAFEHGYRPGLLQPVEQVSFEECADLLWRHGLALPTEAQWEKAARAGTTTPWWAGETIESFRTFENLSDRTFAMVEVSTSPYDAEREDGWVGTAPVGSYPANPFGFHDIIGNVSEWCADRIDLYRTPALPGDGLRADGFLDGRVVRGGSYRGLALGSRSSARFGMIESGRTSSVGVRPARALPRP